MVRYIKSFLFSSILFGLGMTVIYSSVSQGIYRGLFFGVALTVALGLLEWFHTRNMDTGVVKGSGPKRQAQLRLGLPYEAAFGACQQAATSLGANITTADKQSGHIVAKASGGIWSWGEQITFQLSVNSASETAVLVRSQPTVKTTLFDYGKNAQNINNIYKFLQTKGTVS